MVAPAFPGTITRSLTGDLARWPPLPWSRLRSEPRLVVRASARGFGREPNLAITVLADADDYTRRTLHHPRVPGRPRARVRGATPPQRREPHTGATGPRGRGPDRGNGRGRHRDAGAL